MRQLLIRFLDGLNGRNKYIFFIVLILICMVALFLGIYVQFFYKYSDSDPFMIGINIGAKKTAEEYELLKTQFTALFTNDLKQSDNEIEVSKLKKEKEIVYTAYDLVNEDETYYSVDAKIPTINIDTDTIKKVNDEIKNLYYNKANSIMRQTEGNTIYKVSYTAYVNSDILSIVIKDSLKEIDKSEKVSVKTYTYCISNDELITLEDLINLKKTTISAVQSSINSEIKKAYNNAKIIAVEYGNLYERDLASDIYKVEFADTFFLTDDGYVYIIYAYGNNDYTNEMDIVIF